MMKNARKKSDGRKEEARSNNEEVDAAQNTVKFTHMKRRSHPNVKSSGRRQADFILCYLPHILVYSYWTNFLEHNDNKITLFSAI